MARIFSINFSYEGFERSAMISVRPTPFFTEYSITMLDEDLAAQLPGNKIIASGKELVFANAAADPPTSLMQRILHVVADHLQLDRQSAMGNRQS
jgi:hypothetical protein